MRKTAKKLLCCAGIFLGMVILGSTLFYLLVLKPLIPKDPVLSYLPKYESREFYTSGGFQDYTDYAKYTFGEKSLNLEEHPNLCPVTGEDIPEIAVYLDHFEESVENCSDFPEKTTIFSGTG